MTVFILLLAFLFGSIPFGVLITKLFHIQDLEQKGSGNIGATNVSRVAGFWPAGFLTLLLDIGKGSLAVLLATPTGIEVLEAFTRSLSLDLEKAQSGSSVLWAAGMFAVLGHCYTPWRNFRGGKGVATGLGALAVLSPLAALFGLVGFGIAFFQSRAASLASISGLILAAVWQVTFYPPGIHLTFGAILAVTILVRHEKNIDALLENREFSFK